MAWTFLIHSTISSLDWPHCSRPCSRALSINGPQIKTITAFAVGDPAGYDWSKLLMRAEWLFVSRITAALGVKIAFDTNYRSTR